MRKSYIEEYKDLYHGTIKEYAGKIVSAKKFIPSTAGWCGSGVYFYDNRAKAWWSASRTCSIERQKGNNTAEADILIADIEPIRRTYILDLRSPDDLKNFAEFVDQFFSESDFEIEANIGEDECKKLKRAMLLSFYCKENDIKLIVGYFQQQAQERIDVIKNFAETWQLAIGIETIYCAKDPTIICNIRRR